MLIPDMAPLGQQGSDQRIVFYNKTLLPTVTIDGRDTFCLRYLFIREAFKKSLFWLGFPYSQFCILHYICIIDCYKPCDALSGRGCWIKAKFLGQSCPALSCPSSSGKVMAAAQSFVKFSF